MSTMAKSRVANAKTEASSPAEHRKNLIRLLNANSHRHHLWDVFADFCEMGALAMSNSVDLAQRNERENRYLNVIKKYEPSEVNRFPQMLAELTMAMEYGPNDVLGQVFGELELGNSARGQYFTPYSVCQIMASQLIGDGESLLQRSQELGFITLNEPACGAGAMVIAFAESLGNSGLNYQKCLHVTAQDIDQRAVHMTYLQLSLLHIPAIIILGNTISLEERELWYTPAHILGGWSFKISERHTKAEQQNLSYPEPGYTVMGQNETAVTTQQNNSSLQYALF
ncbi:N-6 DNA methylase [Pseudomonas aeruginosa]|jgi:type I restriction-modification system DNA methylase subunit|uniref:N-6 DNA methylase n=1 Tax=Pseudomonas aeruginosa TaxID=287 RepID=UPI001CB75F5A|nr:N-6 DNA methylase [Pseudomonas aeruginosa]MCL8061098.1 N-6 DNA methylase [Pseudomonas aeruginosa]MCS7735716.1 N-6 DNA methylase [Pseudomonas aeruginosa]MCS8087402.1 N-6 DNA methylase [Pseudomonas aeruginosa]MCS8981723.1 N-6 DNA methylase [Pseudomonas aeruginosa]MCT9634035.1 N-6 DNA methylase [Pseudomonas aeruginosa]